MPAAAAKAGGRERPCDIVLGDRFGAACAGLLPTRVERELEALGYRVARNTPYAGGYTTEHYGRPQRRTHALQVEINRALYLDEATLAPTSGFDKLRGDIEQLTARLAAADWSALRAS
jgi:N-formylglutamate amidohydrolase